MQASKFLMTQFALVAVISLAAVSTAHAKNPIVRGRAPASVKPISQSEQMLETTRAPAPIQQVATACRRTSSIGCLDGASRATTGTRSIGR